MKETVFAIGLVLAACGCTSCDTKNTVNTYDGYVPWWVEDGVPNGDGVIVK